LQATKNDCDTADRSSPAKDTDEVQSVLLDTAALVDKTDSSCDAQIMRDDAKLLFGNGKLDRWLSKRRAFNQRPKLKTLDGWLSPSKTVMSSPEQSPSFARTGRGSPEKSPVAPRRRTSSANVRLEFSDPPPSPSPSVDIRKYFHSRRAPQSPSENKHGPSKSEAESQLGLVTVVDLVADSPPRTSLEHSSLARDGTASSQRETAATETNVHDPPQQHNSSSICETADSESHLDWWATSRTKSSTRKGPFKRSLGLVHFLNEVCFS